MASRPVLAAGKASACGGRCKNVSTRRWNAAEQASAFCRELLILYENGEISGAEMRKRILGKAQGRD